MSAAASGAVLVTGASTGIGEATVELLAARGVPVIAGARGAADLERLGAIAGVEALQLDVTDPGHVDELRTRLAGTPLRGLVNNAGIALAGPLEEMPLDELRRQFEVNVFGQIAVTQVALPSLRTGRGRVVNIGSIGGRVGAAVHGRLLRLEGRDPPDELIAAARAAAVGHLGHVHRAGHDRDEDLGQGRRREPRGRRVDVAGGPGALRPRGWRAWARSSAGRRARASSRPRWRGGSSTRCSRAGRGPSTRSAATPTHWASLQAVLPVRTWDWFMNRYLGV